MAWFHNSPIPGHGMEADLDCSGLDFAAKFAVTGDFDGDGRDEIAIAPDVGGTAGNDFWVMKFDPEARAWSHMSPIPGHGMEADLDCSGLDFAAKFAVTGDFDGDGRDEIAIAPDVGGTAGNDFWVMKFDPVGSGQTTAGTNAWFHFGQIPGHGMEVDLDCSGLDFAAKFAVTGDFDGDRRDEITIAPDVGGTAGNDFWVMAPPRCIRVHVKILTAPTVNIADMITAANQIYAFAGLMVQEASREIFSPPAPPPPPPNTTVLANFNLFNTLNVGTCLLGAPSPNTIQLFGNRNGVGVNEPVVYFVLATNPPFNGCASFPAGQPGAVVAQGATRWTFAHELGHVLGLLHVDDPPPNPAAPPALTDRLMTGRGTATVTNLPPDLVASECSLVRASVLSGQCR